VHIFPSQQAITCAFQAAASTGIHSSATAARQNQAATARSDTTRDGKSDFRLALNIPKKKA